MAQDDEIPTYLTRTSATTSPSSDITAGAHNHRAGQFHRKRALQTHAIRELLEKFAKKDVLLRENDGHVGTAGRCGNSTVFGKPLINSQ